MEISLKTYKQLYKAYLEEQDLDDDSASVSGIKAKKYLLEDVGLEDQDLKELASIHNIVMVYEQTFFCEQREEDVMKKFELYFDDLNEDAQTRFRDAGLWHENIEVSPLAIFECENVMEDE
ncbi:MAG: hypothetical protein WAT79_08495 [Saprospiraceae bacterium]